MSEHTKERWLIAEPKEGAKHDQVEDRLIYAKVNGRNFHIAETFQFRNGEFNAQDGVSPANAARIVKCVNSHDALVEENRKLKETCEYVRKSIVLAHSAKPIRGLMRDLVDKLIAALRPTVEAGK